MKIKIRVMINMFSLLSKKVTHSASVESVEQQEYGADANHCA